MEISTVVISAVLIVAGLGSLYLYVYFKDKKINNSALPLSEKSLLPQQLQAYERLVLLADRIALPNLVSRMNQAGVSAKDMQLLLTQTIKQEFEHNITQQIYVSAAAWQAISNLKEQNILVINQVSSFLPQNATGADLNKGLMQLLVENPKASLQTIVSEVLSFEARKMM